MLDASYALSSAARRCSQDEQCGRRERRFRPCVRPRARVETITNPAGASAPRGCNPFSSAGRARPRPGDGVDLPERICGLWTQIHNDGLLELENALRGLQGDLHAQAGTPPPPANFTDVIATNIAEGRVELAAAIQRLVDRIDRFQKLVIN